MMESWCSLIVQKKKGLWIFPQNAWYFWSLEAWALLDPQSASIFFIVTMRVHEPSLTQITFLESKSIIFGKNREPSIISTTSGTIRKHSNIMGGPGFLILRFFLQTPGWDNLIFGALSQLLLYHVFGEFFPQFFSRIFPANRIRYGFFWIPSAKIHNNPFLD